MEIETVWTRLMGLAERAVVAWEDIADASLATKRKSGIDVVTRRKVDDTATTNQIPICRHGTQIGDELRRMNRTLSEEIDRLEKVIETMRAQLVETGAQRDDAKRRFADFVRACGEATQTDTATPYLWEADRVLANVRAVCSAYFMIREAAFYHNAKP